MLLINYKEVSIIDSVWQKNNKCFSLIKSNYGQNTYTSIKIGLKYVHTWLADLRIGVLPYKQMEV
jgi:hypothetical protein